MAKVSEAQQNLRSTGQQGQTAALENSAGVTGPNVELVFLSSSDSDGAEIEAKGQW